MLGLRPVRSRRILRDVTTTIVTTPVDDDGLLLHADDATAQVCLTVVRLISVLERRRVAPADIVAVRLLVVDTEPAAGLVPVVAEELERLAVSAPVGVVPITAPVEAGMLVAPPGDVRGTDHPPPMNGEHMTASTPDLTPLRGLGTVHLPDDPGYETACLAWNRTAVQRPAAVAVPESPDDLARIVRMASGLGLRVAPQTTGHGAGSMQDVAFDDVLLLRMERLTGVQVDPISRTARIQGGTLWSDVLAAIAPHGLTALHGSAGDVAVVGYLLGGGLSFYGRAHGLALNAVRAFDVVAPSGDRVRADAEENADLFWALRGGGGNFGIVVAVELDLLPIADVVAGMMLWDLDRAPALLPAWAQWTRNAPESVTSSFRIMRFPPLPELPPFLSGRNLVVIDGAILEEDDRAAGILAPLRALQPEMDTFARIPAEGVLAMHMDPPDPMPGVSDHAMLTGLPDDAVAALLESAGPGAETPLLIAELRHLGGALARAHDGALARLDGEYALFTVCVVPAPEMAEVCDAATRDVVAAMRPWSTGGRFANFSDRPADAATMFDPPDWERLLRARERHDPERTLVAAHVVGER